VREDCSRDERHLGAATRACQARTLRFA